MRPHEEAQLLSPERLEELRSGTPNDWTSRDAEALLAHIAALEADNAALLAEMREAHNNHESISGAIFEQSHPGAALLTDHAKALVRARNEGLEEAAFLFVTLEQDSEDEGDTEAALDARHWVSRIHAMKETEP